MPESGRVAALLAVVVAVLVGAAAGLGSYTLAYADGLAYLDDDPAACANCHVMQGHLDAWVKSSHKHVAVCNDCHAPHTNLVDKLMSKARNGFFHSYAFTTGNFPDNILITATNRDVTEAACRHCHGAVSHGIDDGAEPLACTGCHASVGHETH